MLFVIQGKEAFVDHCPDFVLKRKYIPVAHYVSLTCRLFVVGPLFILCNFASSNGGVFVEEEVELYLSRNEKYQGFIERESWRKIWKERE